jgi:uncharacterized protein YgbK (DUF1537 family)
MVLIAVLADDLTGAADTGGTFAGAGLRAAIALDGDPSDDVDILVRSTESRGMDITAAVAANRRVAERMLPPQAPRWVYKKFDSMLRGHPALELRAVMAGLGEHRALIAPALPAQGRTTVGSLQRIDGPPVDLLHLFRGELPVFPLPLEAVRRGPDAIAHAIASLDAGILIADAETGADLATIARAALASDLRVLAGTSGFARQLARALPAPEHPAEQPVRRGGPILIVAGSRHPVTAAQVAALEAAGVAVVRPAQAILDGTEPSRASLVAQVATCLSGGRSVTLTTAGLSPCAKGSAFVSEMLAEVVTTLAASQPIGGLVLTGGDVAARVIAGLGATAISLRGEVEPSIPWGVLRSRALPDMPIVTKAGSFGAPDALLRAVAHLGA